MKKKIASLAVILLAVSSLAFYGCGGEEYTEEDLVDPEDELVAPDGEGLEGEEGE